MEEMFTRMQCEWDIATNRQFGAEFVELLKNDNEVLKERYDALLESFHRLQDDYEIRGRVIDHLRSAANHSINECLDEEIKNAELTKQVNKLKEVNTELAKQVCNLKEELRKANDTNAKLRKETVELSKEKVQLAGRIATLELDKQTLTEKAEELSKALVERQGVTDNSVVPFLRRLQEAFNKSVLGSEEVEDHFDAYTALSNLSNVFSEIYCMIDIRLPEDAIFRTIDKFLHEATKNYVENFTLRKEHDTEEDE